MNSVDGEVGKSGSSATAPHNVSHALTDETPTKISIIMASRGSAETALLKENIESQLKRLLTQLQDIESMKDDFDDEQEYNTTKQETIDQLKEFEQSLAKMTAGNMSLVDQIGSVQLAIQSAIRSTTSPEVLNMFLKRENGSLRSKLASLESDHRLGRISIEIFQSQAVDIIKMLDKLKEPLSPSEQEILRKSEKEMSGYEDANNSEIGSRLVSEASSDIKKQFK